jgi:pyruvate dehydrogenase kinase 2/3/4
VRKNPPNEKIIGLVSPVCSPKEIAEQAVHDAAYMCSRTYGDSPQVTFHGRTDLQFPYVPSHLSYVMLELLKNSMRATVETHGVDKMPPIRIVIAGSDDEDTEDVRNFRLYYFRATDSSLYHVQIVIKVSDEGGGIKRSNMRRIWSYLFTTANPAIVAGMLSSASEDQNVRDFDVSSPLAGLGYGLPISRNYCRFFGGELQVMSMEGYGTDSFMYLPRLGNKVSVV